MLSSAVRQKQEMREQTGASGSLQNKAFTRFAGDAMIAKGIGGEFGEFARSNEGKKIVGSAIDQLMNGPFAFGFDEKDPGKPQSGVA